jgi:ABC-type branched-subunit amino acid transport system ATPase component
VTVILVEHLMRAVMALSEELLVLQQGKLIARGDPQTVCNQPEVIRAYFGEAKVPDTTANQLEPTHHA